MPCNLFVFIFVYLIENQHFIVQRTSTPELVSENPDPLWFVSGEKIVSTRDGIKHRLQRVITWCRDLSGDPRIGPLLLLGALLSFGGIWFRRSQPTPSNESSQSQQTHTKVRGPLR